MNSVKPPPLQEGLGACCPVLAQASRFSSSYRYWSVLPVPVLRVLVWLPFRSRVRVKVPIAVGPWGCCPV